MQKWELREGQHVVGMTFDDYAGMVLQDKDAAGFVINPFGENIRIERQVITALKQQQAAYLKRQQLTYERNHPEQAASNEAHGIPRAFQLSREDAGGDHRVP